MTTYRLMDGLSGRPGNGPGTGTSYTGNYIAGTMFDVTTGGLWFTGYYWWVAATGQDTAPSGGFKFALWQLSSASAGILVPGSVVTAASLTAGQWNFVALSAPLLLTPCASNSYGAVYLAAVGYVAASGFPSSTHQFGSGNTYSAGITNGPLVAPSSSGGSAAAGSAYSWTKPQCPFTTASADPSSVMPAANDLDDNLWLDVQVSDQAPASPSYRCFPNSPAFVVPGSSGQASAYTLGLEFSLSQSCALSKIWHYSVTGSTVLPSRCAIWNVGSTTVVSGSDNTSPSWKDPGGAVASAGDGWVYCDYSGAGVTLAASTNYKVSTFTSNNVAVWFLAQASFWGGTPGPFSSGITQGPLSVLSDAASSPGQDSWNQSTTWTYPATSTNPEFDGLDVEVTPVTTSVQLPAFAYQMRFIG